MPVHETSATLGVLAPDSARTILVVAADGELAVALRERVDRAYALIKDVRPGEMEQAIGGCLPWPWMVVGAVSELPRGVEDLLRPRPVLILWRGEPPAGLPVHARQVDRFADLVTAITTALTQDVAGMRLAVGLGVDLPDGDYARSAELQALVSAHPRPFDVSLDAFRSAARVLNAHGIRLRPSRDPASGTVALGKPAEAGR